MAEQAGAWVRGLKPASAVRVRRSMGCGHGRAGCGPAGPAWHRRRGGRNRLSILRLNHGQATYFVSKHFIITALDNKGDERPIAPPASVVRIALDLPQDRRKLPHLEAIRSTPPISDTGEIRTTSGVSDGIFYDGSAGEIVVPYNPTLEDAQNAWTTS